MARTVEEIEADIKRLEDEKRDVMKAGVHEQRKIAARALTFLALVDDLSPKIMASMTAKDGQFDPHAALRVIGYKRKKTRAK
ncbi:MAG: hypothetical protein KGL39_57690 [Patescibacteria group bacterium]|nr:hypothetical protein [Patescibacteria group bacterium]